MGGYEVVGLLNLLGKEMSMFVSRIYRKHSLSQICLYIVYCLYIGFQSNHHFEQWVDLFFIAVREVVLDHQWLVIVSVMHGLL